MRTFGKLVMILSLALLVTAIYGTYVTYGAEEGAGKDEKFAQNKQAALQEIDGRITMLQTAKNCISSAQDREALKHCREEMEKLHEQKRSQELDKKIKQLQDEKAKINQQSH